MIMFMGKTLYCGNITVILIYLILETSSLVVYHYGPGVRKGAEIIAKLCWGIE
jgi:hypothetical protein